VFFGHSASKWVEIRKEIPWARIDWPWSESYSFTQAIRQPMAPNATLRVENPQGDIRVTGSDTNEIALTANKRVRAPSKEDAERLQAGLEVKLVTAEGGQHLVTVPNHPQLRVDLGISVPRSTAVRLEARRGSAEASDLAGDVSADIDRGDFAASNIDGSVRVQLRRGSFSARNVKGSVELDGRGSDIQVADVRGQLLIRGEYSGASDYSNIAGGVKFGSSRTDLEIQKLPGRMEMTLGTLAIREPGGSVSVSTRNKDIRVEDFAEKVVIVNRGASVELRTSKLPLRDIEVENHSGPVEVAIPAKAEFQVEATARRGSVDSEFPSLEMGRKTETGWIKGQVGQAGATLKLSTSYGAIRLKRIGPVGEQAAEPQQPRRKAGVPGPAAPGLRPQPGGQAPTLRGMPPTAARPARARVPLAFQHLLR